MWRLVTCCLTLQVHCFRRLIHDRRFAARPSKVATSEPESSAALGQKAGVQVSSLALDALLREKPENWLVNRDEQMQPAVEFREVRKRFGHNEVLRGISEVVKAGEK